MHDDSYLAIAREIVDSFADDLLSTEAAVNAVSAALASTAATQRERDAAVADFRAFEWREILEQHPDDAMANQRWREACNIGTLIRQY